MIAGGLDETRLSFAVLDQSVEIRCSDRTSAALLAANFGSLSPALDDAPRRLCYAVAPGATPGSFSLSRGGEHSLTAVDDGELLFLLEKDLVIELQRRRFELLFLHAAALEFNGRAYLFVGDSGVGKSTTAWALLHEGFKYLSDELAPIDVERMRVHAYPHALCLKHMPPSFPLPAGTISLRATMHVPTHFLPGVVCREPTFLAGVFMLVRSSVSYQADLRPLRTAEATARLYAHTLNALAHRGRGLHAVSTLASRVPSFLLTVGEVRAMCRLVRDVVKRNVSFEPSRAAACS